MKKMIISLFLLIPVLILGCSAQAENYQIIDSGSYIPSEIEPDFPVPVDAKLVKTQPGESSDMKKIEFEPKGQKELKYARYEYKGLWNANSEKRRKYFEEIEKWGWTELKDQQMGPMHVFERNQQERNKKEHNQKQVRLIIHPEFFTISFFERK